MGMPTITPGNRTQEQVMTDLIESIAMQERALSHIVNAESEKMQAIINMDTVSTQQLLQLNQSVEHMINAAARLETVLQAKLELSNQECNINEEEEVDSEWQQFQEESSLIVIAVSVLILETVV